MCVRQFPGQAFILSFPSISVIDSNGTSVNCLIRETIGVTRWSGLRPPASDAQISKRAAVAYLVSEFIVESPLSMPAAVALVAHRYRIRSRPSRRATAPRVYARRLIVVFAAALAPDPASAAVVLARSTAAATGAGISHARAPALRAPAYLLWPYALSPLSYTLRPLSHAPQPPMPLRSLSLLGIFLTKFNYYCRSKSLHQSKTCPLKDSNSRKKKESTYSCVDTYRAG